MPNLLDFVVWIIGALVIYFIIARTDNKENIFADLFQIILMIVILLVYTLMFVLIFGVFNVDVADFIPKSFFKIIKL